MALTISRRFSVARARSSFRRASSTGGATAMDLSSLGEETLLLPGALVARHLGIHVDRDVNEDGLRLARRGSEGSLQLVPARRVVRPGAQALCVLDEIDRDVVTLEPAALGVPVAELVAKGGRAGGHLQPADALEAAIVDEDDGQLVSLLQRGDDLAVQHQVAAISDQDEHF